MTDQGDPYELVTVATAGSVMEAEIARNTLAAAGIPGFVPNTNSSTVNMQMFHLINPAGVEVQVRACDVGRARKALGLTQSDEPPMVNATRPARLTGPDELAQKAALFGLFSLFPPLAIWAIYYAIRAVGAARRQRPDNRRNFGLNLLCAIAFGLGLSIVITWYLCTDLGEILSVR